MGRGPFDVDFSPRIHSAVCCRATVGRREKYAREIFGISYACRGLNHLNPDLRPIMGTGAQSGMGARQHCAAYATSK
jgi:hypothetical protein